MILILYSTEELTDEMTDGSLGKICLTAIHFVS